MKGHTVSAMKTYETSTTVQEKGEVHVAGVPFKAGTRVDVTITAVQPSEAPAAERVAQLLAALDKARNTEPLGPLRRDELYDRNVVH